MERLYAAYRAIRWLEECCLAWGILAISVLTVTNVIVRAFFGASLMSAEELCRFLMVLVTFVGLGHAAGSGRHIRMTALYDALPTRLRKAAMLLIAAGTCALCAFFCWLSADYVFGTVRALGAVSPVLEIPKWLVYVSVPLGFFLSAVQYALTFVRNLTEDDVYVSFERRDEYADDAASREGAL